MSTELYNISELSHRYGQRTVLRVDRLSLESGQILGLVGSNGSGKSTLLRLMALLEQPSQGRLLYKGVDSSRVSDAQRRDITLLLQVPYLLNRTVFANLAYGLKMRGQNNNLTQRVHQGLEWVGLDPKDFAQRSWQALSGGEAQRVALAARLVLRPQVLLLDEPVSSLDAASAVLVREAALMAQREWGAGLVIASHDLTWLYEVSDQVLHLQQGRPASRTPVNLLWGEWRETMPGGEWRSVLGDGQTLLAPARPAHIDGQTPPGLAPGDIKAHHRPPEPDPSCNLLKGVVLQLCLERFSGDSLMQVKAGPWSLMVRMEKSHLAIQPIYPGMDIWLYFKKSAINWG